MTKTTVKRSPYKVGQVLNHHAVTQIIKGRPIPSCAGFKVSDVTKLDHVSGGYLVSLDGRRAVNGEKVSASFVVTFPLLGRKTRKPYITAFRYFVGDSKPVKQVNIPRSKSVKVEDVKQVAKTTVTGSKKMMLIDFLGE